MNVTLIRAVAILHLFSLCLQAASPQWIWSEKGDRGPESIELKKTITLPTEPTAAKLIATCDNAFSLQINGMQVAESKAWNKPRSVDVAKLLKKGANQIIVHGHNTDGIAGFALRLEGKAGAEDFSLVSDQSWTWNKPGSADKQAVTVIGPMGIRPWRNVFGPRAVVAKRPRRPVRKPQATAPSARANLNVPEGFKAEMLYMVPKAQYGSWVGITVEKGNRLIVCDQHGGIYRVTVPAVGSTGEVKVEEIPFVPGGAHGVTYAFDSLYVAVNERGNQNGFYRLRDTNGDDTYDERKLLKSLVCRSEHGFHSIVPGHDGESLYLVAGNYSKLPKDLQRSRGSRAWGEDHLLPRMWDARGHAKNTLAPAGFILKTDPDGKEYELIASGFRNQFDAAFDPNGELFAFDADMEWDIGAAWYRPTRVNHVVSGAEFGWRSGAGKWPAYYADSLPATVDVGLGSPTGVVFGTKAKFPEKYQRALFINDWTYGTMYAIHLKQDGASFTAEKEDFINGKPLPLTDVVINPNDGAMYFATGGRKGQSALYRVTYVGTAPTAPASYPESPTEAKLRAKLETLHLEGVGTEAVATAWPHLDHPDRFVRWAARVAIEKQPVAAWSERVLAESRPRAIVESVIALARHGEKSHHRGLIERLTSLDLTGYDRDALLPVLRAYQLCFTRLGVPSAESRTQVLSALDSLYPATDNAVNVELAQLLLYLAAPAAVDRTVSLLMTAGDEHQELLSSEILQRNNRYKSAAEKVKNSSPVRQQMILAYHLRSIKDGWTPATRKTYFSWFQRASTWQGGNSLAGYLQNIRKEALKTVVSDADERATLAKLSEAKPAKSRSIVPPKGPGRNWATQEAVSAIENKLSGGRDFKSGENLFHATACAACHRFAGDGGGIGPDLTGAGNRYSLTDLLMNLIEPSKVISDQYGSEVITQKNGAVITGRLGAEEGGKLYVMTNPFDPETMVAIPLDEVVSRKASPVSSMPPGLVNSLNADELADLVAYLLSGGKSDAKYYTQSSASGSTAAVSSSTTAAGEPLFNGQNLDGWKGSDKHWSVEDGVIVGSTMTNRTKHNTFLVWDGGELQDFTLTLEAKLEGQNNSGIQYRSKITDDTSFRLAGYQMDMHPNPPYVGMLYGEGLGRGIIAKRGEKVVVDADSGKPRVVGNTQPPEKLDLSQWHSYEVTVRGNHLIHKVDGTVTTEITDNHKHNLISGVIGLQVHAGKPMKVQFRNIRLQRYK